MDKWFQALWVPPLAALNQEWLDQSQPKQPQQTV
jgi:hypothetical protein